MADRPLLTPLPADLPENWEDNQIVAPSGAAVGLSEQHGYNYLMKMVNRTQRAVNTVNESLDSVSGKRTCRVVVGTSAAGWSAADCDYLCDGTDDQVELNAAVEAVQEKGGGEITILAGEYQLSEAWNIDLTETAVENDIALSFAGEPGGTVLNLFTGGLIRPPRQKKLYIQFSGVAFRSGEAMRRIDVNFSYASFENCIFLNTTIRAFLLGSGSLRFKGNVTEITGTPAGDMSPLYVVGDEKSSCLIDGNEFYVMSYPGSTKIVDLQWPSSNDKTASAGPIFTNNTVISSVADRKMNISMGNGGSTGSNSLVNASINVGKFTPCVGNQVTNGNIRADIDCIVAGNRIQNGSIYTSGYVAVVGNVVSAPTEGDELETVAIALQKAGGDDIPPQRTPIVTGNMIESGKIGIHLQFLDLDNIDERSKKALISGNRISGCATSIQIDSNWSNCLVTGNMIDTSVVDNGTGNIVRLNSDDAGGGGSGTAGVSSFKGRSGAVMPQNGDYTAAMVGAIPSDNVAAVQAVTQAEYDALTQKNPVTLYLIRG